MILPNVHVSNLLLILPYLYVYLGLVIERSFTRHNAGFLKRSCSTSIYQHLVVYKVMNL